MKKLNIYAIDWNSSEQWILEDRDEFDWVEGMFHQKITNEINLDLDVNRLDKFEQLEELWESFQKEHNGTTKASQQRARKAIGEVKKLVTDYRKASVSEGKS